MAIFEIVPLNQNKLVLPDNSGTDLAGIKLQYTSCNEKTDKQVLFNVRNNYQHLDKVNPELKFASAVSMFSLKLKNSRFLNHNISWQIIADAAKASANKDNFLQMEFIDLVNKAEKIYDVKRKRKSS